METTNVIQIGSLAMGLFGGLAIFLFGMEQMTDALKTVAGGGMKALLTRLTNHRLKAIFAGTIITSIIQSSSVTTVLVVGFISAGLMTLTQAVGVILGADIGTTITAQIIAFKITRYALIMIAVGFTMAFFIRQERWRQYGVMLLGLGLIFFGMELMSEATRPLRSYQPFIELMQQMSRPLFGILVGAFFTALIQSSSAAIGIIIVLASQGFINLEAGIALTFGANIGTSVTAILAAIGKPPEAVRAALAHVLTKVVGVLLWYAFIDQLAFMVRAISPVAEGLSGTARLAAETPRQIANAHTLFNVVNTFIFLWFITPLVWLLNRIIPERPEVGVVSVEPKYLDDMLLETPPLALDRVRLELGRLGEYVLRMVQKSLPTAIQGSEADLQKLADMDDDVDALQGAIVTYLGKLSQENLFKGQSEQLYDYMAVANYLENIGDTIETNIVDAGRDRFKHNVQISVLTQEVLVRLHDKVCWALKHTLTAVLSADKAMAQEVIVAKDEINRLTDEVDGHLARRLVADEAGRLALFRLETDMNEYLKRLYYFAKRIAKVIVEMSTDPDKEEGDMEVAQAA